MNKKTGFIKSAGLMHNIRAQGLPMNTIIIIILVLFVLAGVGIFFFTQFAQGGEGASQANCIQLCESIKSNIASIEGGTWSDVKDGSVAENFCNGFNSVPKSGCTTKLDCYVIYKIDGSLDKIGSTNAPCP